VSEIIKHLKDGELQAFKQNDETKEDTVDSEDPPMEPHTWSLSQGLLKSPVRSFTLFKLSGRHCCLCFRLYSFLSTEVVPVVQIPSFHRA
jgi:hypothetical protein